MHTIIPIISIKEVEAMTCYTHVEMATYRIEYKDGVALHIMATELDMTILAVSLGVEITN